MIFSREKLEAMEEASLAPYALKSNQSKGRLFEEEKDKYRTCFQRDRDRVIHSKAFRRLKGKTQVFIARFGDHYRSRLTHTMEVAQLSRDMARTLNLNEDLAETIALAHDLGHTPFGHSGQDAMHEMMQQYGGRFEHNEQSKRVVEKLEEKSHLYGGLNLTYEVKDGLIKHRTFYDDPLSKDTLMPSIEAQMVNIADEIAYLNHDIDDGIRAGILNFEDFEYLKIWKKAKETVSDSMPKHLLANAMKSSIIKLMTKDLVENTHKLIEEKGIDSIADIYKHQNPLSAFSEDFYKDCVELKSFLYKRFYHSEEVKKYNDEGQEIIRILFKKLISQFELMPEEYCNRFKTEEKHIVVKDYIAGMTDHFAIELYEKLK